MIALGIVLPVAFVAGIAFRKATPGWVTPVLPGESRSSEVLVWERDDLFLKIPIRLRLLRTPTGYAVDFFPSKDFTSPDLLVYWVTGNSRVTDVLPDNARLLGAFNPPEILPLPHDAEFAGGGLVLYSLADHELVDWTRPISFGAAKP